jgi:hypothetical protein
LDVAIEAGFRDTPSALIPTSAGLRHSSVGPGVGSVPKRIPMAQLKIARVMEGRQVPMNIKLKRVFLRNR